MKPIKRWIKYNYKQNWGLWGHIYFYVIAWVILSIKGFEILDKHAILTSAMIIFEWFQVLKGKMKFKSSGTFKGFIINEYGGDYWRWFDDSTGDVIIPLSLGLILDGLKLWL